MVISGLLDRYCCPVTSMTEESAKTNMALKKSCIAVPQSDARPNKLGRANRSHTSSRGAERPCGFSSHVNLVAVAADTDADTGSPETNTAVIVVTPTLDITLTRSVGV